MNLKKLTEVNNLKSLLLIIISLIPLISLDYLITDLPGPNPSTVIYYILIPLILLIAYFKLSKNFKKSLIILVMILGNLAIYFAIHVIVSKAHIPVINLSNRSYYDLKLELFYFIKVLLPVFTLYILLRLKVKLNDLKLVTIISSLTTALPIVVSNLIVFSYATYGQTLKNNIFHWYNFSLDKDPREYTSKFFFKEGNTLGILLFVLLVLQYLFLYKAKKKKEKIFFALLVFITIFAMVMLGTRVSTYSTLLISLFSLASYFIINIIKRHKLQLLTISFTILMCIQSFCLIQISPAKAANKINNIDNAISFRNEDYRKRNTDVLRAGNAITNFDDRHFYFRHIFEDNEFLIYYLPRVYYRVFYDYRFDPEFWVNFIFNYDFYQRVNGRQLEAIFMNYKLKNIGYSAKLFGSGYSPFETGSIILERDFVQQTLTYGYIGSFIMFTPWLVSLIYIMIKFLFKFKTNFRHEIIHLLLINTCVLVLAYLSGHTMDEFITSLMLSLSFACLIGEIKNG